MKNGHALITGITGSGKSTFVRDCLLPELPRWLALDPQGDYESRADRSTSDIGQLGEWLILHGSDSRFRIAFTADEESAAAAMFAMVWELYSRPLKPPSLLLVVDEAHLWSDSRNILPELGRLVRAGRKWGLAILSLTQRDVNIHRDLRLLAAVKVAFHQDAGFSDDFARAWFASRLEAVTRLHSLDWPREKRPLAGRHFLTDPPGVDLVAFYKKLLVYDAAPPPPPASRGGLTSSENRPEN